MMHYLKEGIRIPSQVMLHLAFHVPMFRATSLQGLVDSKENVKPHRGSSGHSLQPHCIVQMACKGIQEMWLEHREISA